MLTTPISYVQKSVFGVDTG